MKIMKALILLVSIVIISGCGNPVSSVKNGILPNRVQTTVGNAFNAFFNEPTWKLKVSENKTQFVEFTGKAKKDISSFTLANLIIPQGGKVLVQFILMKDGSFKIGYVEAPFKACPGSEQGLSQAELDKGTAVFLMTSGFKANGSVYSLPPVAVDTLLNAIYSN